MNEHSFIYKRRKGVTLFAALLLSTLLLVIDTRAYLLNPAKIGSAVFSTFQGGFSAVGNLVGNTVNSVAELKKLKTEYNALQKKIEEYQIIQRDIVDLKRENERLKKLIGFTRELPYTHVTSQIIAKDPSAYFLSFTIDKGTRNGVRNNMPVIAYQNGFQGVVGKILEAGPNTSKVLPVISANCFIATRLQSSMYEGLVQGGGGIHTPVLMRYVVKTAKEDIQFGDLIETSGMDSIYPSGIFVGRVRSIGSREWEPDLELSIEPIVDFSRLQYVVVLKDNLPGLEKTGGDND